MAWQECTYRSWGLGDDKPTALGAALTTEQRPLVEPVLKPVV